MSRKIGQEERSATKPLVAVLGATGYTGRFVVTELQRRGIMPISIARSVEALSAANFPESRQATVDDAASLDRALHGARAVINCAGPFGDTADAVATAALRAGIHYLDVTAEQGSASKTLETFDEPARRAGVAIVPSMAFFGGLPDLMVTAVLGGWDRVDSIEVMVGFDRWHPTQGTRNTIERKGNLIITEGRLAPTPTPPTVRQWTFADPLGDQAMVEVPFTEVPLISRHVKTTELHSYLTQIAVNEVLNPTTPFPKAVDAMGRSAQRFVVEVVVTRGSEHRHAVAHGRDGYAVTAPLVCEAVERLLNGQFSAAGAHAPGEIFDARALLAALGSEYPVEYRDQHE